MRERSKIDQTHESGLATLEQRLEHIRREKMDRKSLVYLKPDGRVPYEVMGLLKEKQKGLILLRAANDGDAHTFATNPVLYTTKKPLRAKKPGSRH